MLLVVEMTQDVVGTYEEAPFLAPCVQVRLYIILQEIHKFEGDQYNYLWITRQRYGVKPSR